MSPGPMEEQVGRYKLAGKLGKGAMGMVFLAEDPLLHRQVAMKTIDLSVEEPEQRGFLLDRLLRDARAAAALSHPHIVSVYDILQEGDRAWIVMEYIAGQTLAQRMASPPPPDVAFTLRILSEVAAALDYTHARGVIHRDIKPSNIMIEANGSAKIMDFGIARLSGGRTTTPTGMVMGTVEYMAPEQVKGEPLDGRADQFSLAAVAYQVLTGSTLFGPQSLTTLTYKLVNEGPLPARVRNPNLPPGVDDVFNRALSKQPAERFVNCAGFVSALSAAFSGPVPAQPPTERTPVEEPARKNWLWPAVAGVVVLAGLAVGGVMLMHRQPAKAKQPLATIPQQAAPQPATPQPSPAPLVTAPSPATRPAVSANPATPPETKPGATHALVSGIKKLIPGRHSPDEKVDDGDAQAEAPAPVEAPPPIERPTAPDPAERSIAQATAAIQKRDFAGAIVLLSKVIAANPRSAQAYELRGLANQELKQFQNAIDDYTVDLQFNPTHAYALHQRGICHVQLKQDNFALADFDSALHLRSDFATTYVARGFLYNRRHAYKKAMADFTQAIALNPRLPNAYRGRMIARRNSGDMEGASQDQKMFNELRTR